ncbi:MAG: hypothetical protein P8J33_01635 [Pirellulaceae bacterium]|nr:hypothetical protein [Pirellulaceae bacterium]
MFASKKQTALFVILVMTWVVPRANYAQLSENEMAQYLAPKTFIAINLNMEAIVAGLGENNELLEEFRARDAANLWDPQNAIQILMILTNDELETVSPFDMPFATLTRYADVIDQASYLEVKNKMNGGLETFEPQSLDGQDLMVGQYSTEFGGGGYMPTNAFFFPVEDIVVNGALPMMKAMLGNQKEGNEGPEFVSNLNFEAEFHCILEDGNKFMTLPMFADIFSNIGGPDVNPNIAVADPIEMIEAVQRLEILFDSNQPTPLQATVELVTEKSAKQLEELIKVGIQAAPAFLVTAESGLEAGMEDAPYNEKMVQKASHFIELAKTAIKELKVDRKGSTIQIELAGIEGLKELPSELMSLFMLQQIEQDQLHVELEKMIELEIRDDGVR